MLNLRFNSVHTLVAHQHICRLLSLLVAASVFVAPIALGAQAGAATDIIVGRVTDTASKLPLDQAAVTATSVVTGRVRTVVTAADGRFLIVFADGGGRYILRVRRLGYAAAAVSVERRAEADRINADVALSVVPTVLERVVITAAPVDSGGGSASGTGRTLTLERLNRLPLDDAGDLAAIASLTPGVISTAATDTTTAAFSVAGQRPTQNHITLDGLTFAAGTVPRDAVRSTRVVTSTYDVAKGQFSGGEVASSTRSGTNAFQSSLTYDGQPEAIQVGAAPNAAFSRQYSLNRFSGSAGGPIARDRLFAFGAVEFSRRENPLATLLVSDPATDARLGIAPDTVTSFLNTVSALGIPLEPSGIPTDQTQDKASFLGRMDFVLNETNHVTLRGDWSGARASGTRGSPRGLLQNVGHNTRSNSGVLAGLTSQLGSFTNDVRATVQSSSRDDQGYVALPRGRVFISSTGADGAISTYDASVGGNQDFPATSSSKLFEGGDEVSWLSASGAHRLKTGFLVNHGTASNDVSEEKFGVFFFNSLDDFRSGTPASFERVLSATSRNSSRFGAALYVGDAWQPRGGLEIDYGLRLEQSRYGDAPQQNAAVQSAFGLSTGVYPSETHLSPRLGFSYSSGGDRENATGWQFRGGIGEFRGVIPDRVFANAAQSTGLPGGQTKVTCTGDGVPTPDWRTYLADPSTIPTSCVGGSSGSSATLPSVIAFGAHTAAPRTWRSSLGATHHLAGPFAAALDVFYVSGVSQLGIPDVNLRPEPYFTLGNEAGRPIYVPASTIDPTTGAVSINASRSNPAFGEVSEVRSFLRSRTRQATLSISGESQRGLGIDASYTYTNARDQSLGYEGEGPDDNAFGNPNVPVWGRSDDERRHQFEASITMPVRKWMELAVITRLVSGFPFSARLATDINGDGQRNDRAFVFDPAASTTDSSVAAGMRQLLTTGTSTARQCLPRQFGQPAQRNGCSGPWVPGFDLKVTTKPKWGFARKTTISLTALNTLVGIDELLHGASRIHGWGQDASVDQRLLFVTGFDPSTQTFKYRVNQHFGAASGALNPFRIPFALSLQARLEWGGKGGEE